MAKFLDYRWSRDEDLCVLCAVATFLGVRFSSTWAIALIQVPGEVLPTPLGINGLSGLFGVDICSVSLPPWYKSILSLSIAYPAIIER